MQPDPAKRYAMAADLAADLERFAAAPQRRRCRPLALAGIGLFVGSWAVFGHIARVPTYPPEQLAVKILGRQLRHDFQADFGIIGLPKGNPALLAEGQRIAFRIKADRDCYVGIGTLMAEVK